MKELPEVNTSFGDLYRTLYEPIRTKLLLIGIKLGIFDQLSEPNEFEAVSEAIDTYPVNTRRFIDGLIHEGTKPRDMTLGMVSRALMGLDMGLNQGFIAESMLRCGFQSVRSQTIDVIVGQWELDIGRKV